MKKKILGVAVLLGLLVTGCGAPKLKNGEEVVAEIDGLKVTANQIYDKMKKNQGLNTLLDIIDTHIAEAEIKTTDELNKEVDGQISYYKTQFEDFAATLAQYGFANEEEFRVTLTSNLKKTKLSEKYYQDNLTDEEIKKYYDESFSGKMDVRHILIKPEEKTEQADKDAANLVALEKAKALIVKLNEGADFVTLAKENSDDTSKENGGLIENVTKDGFVEEFFTASLALKDNEYTKEPVKSQYGYHVILKIKGEEKPALDKAKKEIKVTLAKKIIEADEKANEKALAEIRKEKKIKISDKDIKVAYNSSIDALKKDN